MLRVSKTKLLGLDSLTCGIGSLVCGLDYLMHDLDCLIRGLDRLACGRDCLTREQGRVSTVLTLPMTGTVLKLGLAPSPALTVLYVALTVLYASLTGLYAALTVLHAIRGGSRQS